MEPDQDNISDHLLDLQNGVIDAQLLPTNLIRAAAQFTSSAHKNNSATYFSHIVAEFLTAYDGRSAINPAHIVSTSGIAQAVDLLCTMLSESDTKRTGAYVLVEDTTYFGVIEIIRNHGLDVRSVATDEYGIIPEDLRRQLEELDPNGRLSNCSPFPVFLYIIPNFHNPTGRTLSLHRKRQICALAELHQLPIISDEVYNLLNYSVNLNKFPDPSNAPVSMSSLGCPYVISLSSFSKILAPGLRVGWIEFPTDQLAEQYKSLGFWCSGSNSSHFSSCIVVKTMEMVNSVTGQSELYNHICNLRSAYACRYTTLCSSLVTYSADMLPPGEGNQLIIEGWGDPNRPVGGYFIWVKLPVWATASQQSIFDGASNLLDQAKTKYHLSYRLGCDCAPNPGLHPNHIRLCFAKLPPLALVEGARRLCCLLRFVYDSSRNIK